MEKRLILFLSLAVAIVIGSVYLQALLNSRNPPAKDEVTVKKGDAAGDQKKKPDEKAGGDKGAQPPAPAGQPAVGPIPPAANPPAAIAQGKPAEEAKQIPDQWFTLGSAAPPGTNNPYEMLVTLTNQGAAVERIELSDPRYRDVENRAGYLGSLALTADPKNNGCRVNVVGPETPAEAAKLQLDDVILELNGQKTDTPQALIDELNSNTKPDQSVAIKVLRAGANQTLTATLSRRPLPIVCPEVFDPDNGPTPADLLEPGQKHDPLSLLLTLRQIDNDAISADADKVDGEITGLHLRTGKWDGKRIDADTVEFTRKLPKWDLEIIKRYQLAQMTKDEKGRELPAYHLTLHIEIKNKGTAAHTVAYQLDGATGLPFEGWWYASRIYPGFSGAPLRNVGRLFQGQKNDPDLISCSPFIEERFKEQEAQKAGKKEDKKDEAKPTGEVDKTRLIFVATDAQYFAAALMPQHGEADRPWLADVRPIVVGEVPTLAALRKKVDVTCRLTSNTESIEPDAALKHDYQVFVGPKLPSLLEQYGPNAPDPPENLSGLVYYGWFGWVSKPMVAVLTLFHLITGNYGISIIMLTVLVRLCMFPLSRKQAMSAKKMQELQPEMKRINEVYKTKPEEKTRATQELWKKHNYNPLGGCLLVFVQLPIFMGLYRSLMVNVELRGASLVGHTVRWCSNLAAPDMLTNWTAWMPGMLSGYTGWLGPYLNILPLFTVGLFIWQQSMFMPPATDDQTAMQQKMMKYMTLFMGVMFFKVASGLCLYFIASSLWGIGERKLLPSLTGGKSSGGTGGNSPPRPGAGSPGPNGNPSTQRRRQRGRR